MVMTSMALQSALHSAAAPTVRAAFKTWLSYQNDTIIAFSFEANKYKANVWTLSYFENSGLI